MADLLARRGFLRGLAHLPLVGGAVSIIGAPTKAAVPVTEELKDRYIAWLAHEHRAALWEREIRPYPHQQGMHPNTVPMYSTLQTFYMLERGELPARRVGRQWVASRRGLRARFAHVLGEAA